MPGIDSPSKLIVQANGTGATFIDSAPVTPKTINANGNAAQVQRKFNGTAAWFDATDGNLIQVPDSSDFNFGSGEYTIEAFVMFKGLSGSEVICEQYTDGSNYSRLEYSTAGGVWQYAVASGGGLLFTAVTYSHSPTLNTWYHIAIRRSGTDIRMYLDGVSVASQTATFTYPNYTNGWAIGGTIINSGYGLLGWIKELRISNVARTVSVPTTQYTSDANTVLLLHLDNPLATSPIAPAIFFDGTGDYLTVPTSSDFAFGTGDFTLEGWIRMTTVGVNTLIGLQDTTNGVDFKVLDSTTLRAFVVGSSFDFTTATLQADRWYHMALSRSGTSLYCFLDGRQQGATGTSSGSITNSSGGTIGAAFDFSNLFRGSIKNVRVSNTARYTAAFTPTQTPFVVDSNTKLLIRGDESNGATTFIDSETSPKTITTVGNTVIKYIEDYRATIVKDDGNTGHKPYVPVGSRAKVDFVAPFGSGVGIFDGTGDFLDVADSADWDFGTGDFTLEAWVRFRSVSGTQSVIEVGNAGTTGEKITAAFGSSQIQFIVNNVAILTPSSTAIIADTWFHIAMSRVSSSLKSFYNGVLQTSAANSDNVSGSSAGVRIASDQFNQAFNGYLDNARISNEGRYSATFNPPEEFTNALGFMSFFLDM